LGIKVALNEPWSAKEGFMYAADQFSALTTGVIMLELRQDLAVKNDWRQKVVQATEKVLREQGHN
jgi:predicted N-formylglutamate amidohydrolase